MTEDPVPIEWSVRDGERIKWTKPMPAGGQSGIAIAGDLIFLTINPPLETSPYKQLEAEYSKTRAEYERRYQTAATSLSREADPAYLKALAELEQAKVDWENLLSSTKGYAKASAKQRAKIRQGLRKKDPAGKALSDSTKAVEQLVHNRDPDLMQIQSRNQSVNREMRAGGNSADIILLCLNAETGKTLWERTVRGELVSDYNYGFSDSTTPCPITDGEYVWAINASGGMACFTIEGDLAWERSWMPSTGRPFNKQYDSIRVQKSILSVEPPLKGDAKRNPQWNYLHAFDTETGEHQWTSEDAITHYNTPIYGKTASGQHAVLIGRGGPHGVPERPVGLSLVSAEPDNGGKAIWHWESTEENKISGWGSLNTQFWDTGTANWIQNDTTVRVDTTNGKQLGQHTFKTIDQLNFDETTQQYQLTKDVELESCDWAWYANFPVGDRLYFLARHAPYLFCQDLETGKTIQLELPREFNDDGSYVWHTPQSNDGLNSRGQRHSNDSRTLGDGFQRCFLGTPTLVNNYLFFTNAIGIVYVIDTEAETFDQRALVAVNDLGQRGQTWTVNSLSYANGNIYHRTLKEVICIGN
ncbi:MAG: PQQ-binding-like beta-propeller repeat protein [Verrucomicrobiota bacterium]